MSHLISMFDGSVTVDRTRGEVAARCDSESANVLAMNTVHEIVTGRRTVEGAREDVAERFERASRAGSVAREVLSLPR